MVENLAKELGLKGYVENMYDESVHIVAEGGEKELEKLLEFCKKGPSAAQIENVEINWSKGTGEFKDFKVKY
jgi:acylphosphatase